MDNRVVLASVCKVSASCVKARVSPLISTSTDWKSAGTFFRFEVNARPVLHAACDKFSMSPKLGTVMMKVQNESCNVWRL